MHIYVIGDGISIQYGPYLEAALRGTGIVYSPKEGTDEANLNLDVPQGANGGDSSRVLAFLRARAAAPHALPADTVLLNCGLHDIKTDPVTAQRQVPLDVYGENLRELVSLIVGTMRKRLVWIRTTPCDDRTHNSRPNISFHRHAADNDRYNAVADACMAEAGIPVIDLHAFTLNLGPELYCDHVHFTDAVRRQQGAFIAGWLQAFKALS